MTFNVTIQLIEEIQVNNLFTEFPSTESWHTTQAKTTQLPHNQKFASIMQVMCFCGINVFKKSFSMKSSSFPISSKTFSGKFLKTSRITKGVQKGGIYKRWMYVQYFPVNHANVCALLHSVMVYIALWLCWYM